eukprot:COSAG06_NODE_3521_length_5231_cov_3.342362_3_plen_79_part_00
MALRQAVPEAVETAAEKMVSRASNIEAVNRQLDIGSQGSELHAVIKARQWSGAASLIQGGSIRPVYSYTRPAQQRAPR